MAATPLPPRSQAPLQDGTEFAVEALPQSRGAGVGAGELSKLRGPPFPKFFRSLSYDPRWAGCETLQTLIMIGPLQAFAVFQVSPAAPGSGDPTPTTFAKGAGSPPPRPQIETLQTLQNGVVTTRDNVCFSKFCLRPMGAAIPLPS